MRLAIVLIGAVILGLPLDCEAQSVGVTAGLLGRYSESLGSGQTGAFGVWLDLGQGKWDMDVDLAGTQARGSAPASSERSWIIGVAGRRRFVMSDRPEVLHVLIGGGAIFSRVTYGDTTYGQSGCGLLTGIGMDIPVGHVIARIQYRLHIGFPSAQQFRLGIGWSF